MRSMIKINKVSKSYDGGRTNAVDGIDLEINDGEIFGFLGPNGAGKTTTIRMATGILSIDSGSIQINRKDIAVEPISAKKQLGFVPDDPNIFLRLKGLEYLNFMGDMYGVSTSKRRERIKDLAEKFEISNALGNSIQSYSHGMRQKIIIIGALMHSPPVWILDEPMTGLDPKSSFILKEMMRCHAAENNTVFFSTHVLEVAEKICDRVAVLNKGKVIFCGKIEDMRASFAGDESLEKMFLEMTE